MEERILKIEAELQTLKERNKKVESDKAWEISWFRILTIAVITYVVALLLMRALGSTMFYLNAVVPVLGYLLSVQSLPLIKDWWLERQKVESKAESKVEAADHE